MLGADAVLSVRRQRCPEVGWGGRRATGLAVRLDDADTRKRLRLRWYFEEACALFNRLLLLLVLQAAALLLIAAFLPAGWGLQMATGETPSQWAPKVALALGILYAWPLVLLVLLRALRWPQLLRTAGLVVLAVTTGRILTVWLAQYLAARNTGAWTTSAVFLHPINWINWIFIIAGIVLCVRTWRLAGDARHVLPPEVQAVSTRRKVWARGLFAVTALYALAFLALAGVASYQTSAFLLQPGVDPQREQQALLALNQGLAQVDKGDLAGAELSWQRSLRLWEELTARPSAPPRYRANLAMTLNNLGWLCQRQGRDDDAEKFYARAVALADGLPDELQRDPEFSRTMAGAREALAGLRGDARVVRQALLALNQGIAHLDRGELVPGEQAFQQSLRLWEKLAAGRPAPPNYRANLGLTLNNLGWIRQQQGRTDEAMKYYDRVLTLADGAADGPQVHKEVKQQVAYAQKALADLRGIQLSNSTGAVIPVDLRGAGASG
jgi:tetratricopeptide (TPR) repeat protein